MTTYDERAAPLAIRHTDFNRAHVGLPAFLKCQKLLGHTGVQQEISIPKNTFGNDFPIIY